MSSMVHVGIVRPKHDADHITHKIVGGVENQPSFIIQTKHECNLLILTCMGTLIIAPRKLKLSLVDLE
jgi:hypothetical protein